MSSVAAAIEPIDIIDWLLLKDIVALTWEIQRSRRQRESVVRMGRFTAMGEILDEVMPRAGSSVDLGRVDAIPSLASKWLRGEAKAT